MVLAGTDVDTAGDAASDGVAQKAGTAGNGASIGVGSEEWREPRPY
jgi:hypothetical protein